MALDNFFDIQKLKNSKYNLQLNDTIIATFYNDEDDINEMVHTVCIVYNGKKYIPYNMGRNAQGTLSDLLGGKIKIISLIGIKGEWNDKKNQINRCPCINYCSICRVYAFTCKSYI